ncbi:MAG: DUF1778 domain-containing protein [Candidatus Dechloromonas phosphoritropha]|jgi:uncharacterized protein (DUF1778 family)|nr:DUF1778 domain-containing protein [Candidatus Dechloromonas phosphoritropha]
MQTNNHPGTGDKSRTARLEARLSAEQKALLQQAAELSGRTLSEFVVASAQEVATRVIQEHETIRLSRADQIAFVTALLDPPAPNERLRHAAAAYRQQVEQR